MQTPIAQTLALAIHGNAAVQGFEVQNFFPSNSTCTFCKSVSFHLQEWEGDELRQRPFAATPQEWIKRLRNAGAQGFAVRCDSLSGPRTSGRESVGFVGGGGRWLIQVLLPRSAELWEATWSVGDRHDPEKRIWRVSWARVDRRREAHPIRALDLDAIQGDLERLLPEIADFARRHGLETFIPFFERGLACLRSETPLDGDGVYHRDLAPPGLLSLQAEQLLGAAQAAWVFGGMGSWNDVLFEGAVRKEYDQLSDRLYDLLNQAAVAAANSSAPRLPLGEEPTGHAKVPLPREIHRRPPGLVATAPPPRFPPRSTEPGEGEEGYETPYNLKGLLFLALAAAVGFVGDLRRWWMIFDAQSLFVSGLVITALDLAYRATAVRRVISERTEPVPQPAPSPFRHRGDENGWLTSSLGGSLLYHPAWLVGGAAALLLGGIARYFE